MGDALNRPTDSRPALASPALREFVRLLAEVAVEKYLDEAGGEIEQQSPATRAYKHFEQHREKER